MIVFFKKLRSVFYFFSLRSSQCPNTATAVNVPTEKNPACKTTLKLDAIDGHTHYPMRGLRQFPLGDRRLPRCLDGKLW